MSKPFFFTQNSEGSIIEVEYPSDEPNWITDFKKGVASVLHMQLKPTDTYSLSEYDASGHYTANYTISETPVGTQIHKQKEVHP